MAKVGCGLAASNLATSSLPNTWYVKIGSTNSGRFGSKILRRQRVDAWEAGGRCVYSFVRNISLVTESTD